MAFYANLGYGFKLPGDIVTDGSIVLAHSMAMHQLERRKINKRYPHMDNRLFDPQLYLAGLDPIKAQRHCVNLASYPWFGIQNMPMYESTYLSQNDWKKIVKKNIGSKWPRSVPTDASVINDGVIECIEFQNRHGCEAVILPSPLTTDPVTSYEEELMWLDEGIKISEGLNNELPLFATVALSDICVRYTTPSDNRLLDLIADSISAREVDGVYIVLEQGSEPNETRHCGDVRSLHSMLTLVHYLSRDAGLRVVVNFMGAFGLALEAAGADIWASAWYKSLYRLRLPDTATTGRAYPLYWSYGSALDVHLDSDFDNLAANGNLGLIEDRTPSSKGLLAAAKSGASAKQVPAWAYRPSNVTAAREHFFQSAKQAEELHFVFDETERMDFVQAWLENANDSTMTVSQALGADIKTKTQHVNAWYQAFMDYRADQRI